MIKVLITIMIFIGLMSCASGPQFSGFKEIEDGKGELYLLRPSATGLILGMPFEVEGVVEGEIFAKGYKRISLAPGTYKVLLPKSNMVLEDTEFPIVVEPGKRYFYAVMHDVGDHKLLGITLYRTYINKSHIALLSEQEATSMLSNLNES